MHGSGNILPGEGPLADAGIPESSGDLSITLNIPSGSRCNPE